MLVQFSYVALYASLRHVSVLRLATSVDNFRKELYSQINLY